MMWILARSRFMICLLAKLEFMMMRDELILESVILWCSSIGTPRQPYLKNSSDTKNLD